MPNNIAYFAAGCFWGIEAAFRRVDGVTRATVGYMGGKTRDPTYELVCSDRTGHAETVRVEFDPARISYHKLLETFWRINDPTTLNRQGPDIGSQYRSAIFYCNNEQKAAADASKKRLDRTVIFARPIVTEIRQAGRFYPAEEYHQCYYERMGIEPHCGLPVNEMSDASRLKL